jgi:hypothetical protein
VFHKTNGEGKQAAAAAGTPNVSSISVDATGGDDGGDDFLDSMIDPVYLNNSTSTFPDATTTINAAVAAPYNTASNTVGSFVDLPTNLYTTFTDATTSGNLHQVAVPNPTGSSSYSSSWENLLHAGHPMGGSYDLHDQQAMMARALGGVISPNFPGGGLRSSSSSAYGVLQQNSLVRNYGGTNHLTSAAAATAKVTGPDAKNNLGAY